LLQSHSVQLGIAPQKRIAGRWFHRDLKSRVQKSRRRERQDYRGRQMSGIFAYK
jgi:hypothetical protein